MLMGAYETEQEKYGEGFDVGQNFDGLGFSFRRALRRASKVARRLPTARIARRVRRGLRSKRFRGFARRLPTARIARRLRSRRFRGFAKRAAFGRALPFMRSRRMRNIFSRRARALTKRVLRTPRSRLPVKRAPGRKKFLRWLMGVDPMLYKKVMVRVENDRRMRGRTISGLDLQGLDLEGLDLESGMSGLWDDIKDTLTSVVKTGVTMAQQRDLYKLQLARAEKGLPPLPAESVAPTIKTQIEIGPETRGQLFAEVGAGLKKFVVPLAIGGVALYMFTRK